MPSVGAERLREKFSGIRSRSVQPFPVVPSWLNHPYPAKRRGKGPRTGGSLPQRASVASGAFSVPFLSSIFSPSLPDPGGFPPLLFRPREGREGPSRPRGPLAGTWAHAQLIEHRRERILLSVINRAYALAPTVVGMHAPAHTRPPPPRTRSPLRWIVRARKVLRAQSGSWEGGPGEGCGRGPGRGGRPPRRVKTTTNGTNPHPFGIKSNDSAPVPHARLARSRIMRARACERCGRACG